MTRARRADRPPPLARRRPPVRRRLRILLWRARFVVAALLLAVAARGVLDTVAPEPVPSVAVAVAARALDAGTMLEPADVEVRHVPARTAPESVPRDLDDVVGRTLAVHLTTGTPLVPGVLVATDATGPPGTVVAAVRLADESAAGLLAVGQRVDVIAATPEGGSGTVVATRALVLPAPTHPAGSAGVLAGLGTDDGGAPPLLLAVTPDEALALAGASASALLSAVVVP